MSVEHTTKLATIVNELSEAWAFVMEHVDEVGPDPQIQVSPIWSYGGLAEAEASVRRFEVAVSGMVAD